MARPKKKKNTEDEADSPLRRLTRSMSMKLSDLPAFPMDKILDGLTTSTSYAELVNLRKTSKYWRDAVDEFLARRPPIPVASLEIYNRASLKEGFTVTISFLPENIPLNPFGCLRKTGVKRGTNRAYPGRAKSVYLAIRVCNARDPIIDKVARLIGTVHELRLSLKKNSDLTPMFRLLKHARVLEFNDYCCAPPPSIHDDSYNLTLKLVQNVSIARVEVYGNSISQQTILDIDSKVESAFFSDYSIFPLGVKGYLHQLPRGFWEKFLLEKLSYCTVKVNGEELTKTKKIDLSHIPNVYSVEWIKM